MNLQKSLDEYFMKNRTSCQKKNLATARKLKKETALLAKDVLIKFEAHIEDNNRRFAKLDEFIASIQPMVDIFNDNTTARMVFEKKTKTWYIYSKEALTVGALIAALWKIITFHQ